MTTTDVRADSAREEIQLTASADLQAAAGGKKLPRISALAYTGGLMTVPSLDDVVIDLAGLDLSGGVAILSDHDSSRSGVLGHGEAEVKHGQLYVRGTISATGPAAAEIVAAAKNGYPWQCSVGVAVIAKQRVRGPVAVNGKTIEVPSSGAWLVTAGKLREISIVALGCDDKTAASIAAQQKREHQHMTTAEATIEAREGAAAESERINAIRNLCGGKHGTIEAQAIRDGWDSNRTELEILRAERPTAPSVYVPQRRPASPEVLQAAIAHAMGRPDIAEGFGERAAEQGERIASRGPLGLAAAGCAVEHIETGGMGGGETVRAFLSTNTAPTAFGSVANKILLQAYSEGTPSVEKIAMPKDVQNFHTHTAIRSTLSGSLAKVPVGGEVKHASLREETITFKCDTYAKLFRLGYQDVINDELGTAGDIVAAAGRMARRSHSDLAFEVLMANGGDFFSSGNGNYISGATTVLGIASLSQAFAKMRTQTDLDGNPLDLAPATLAVPPALESTARALLNSEYIAAAEGSPTGNSLRNAVELIIEPRLSNAKFTGNSAAAWYVFAARSAAPMIAGYLRGQRVPTVESFGLQHDATHMAMAWRVHFDYGFALGDYRAAVKSKGSA